MNRETQIAILDASNARCKEIMLSKSKDYANEDVLSNFKMVAKIEGSTPVKDILGHIANKVVRLGNLLGNDQNPNHESIEDTAVDAINYFHLLIMAIKEAEGANFDCKVTSDGHFTGGMGLLIPQDPCGTVSPSAAELTKRLYPNDFTIPIHNTGGTVPINTKVLSEDERRLREAANICYPSGTVYPNGDVIPVKTKGYTPTGTVNHKTQHDKSNEQIKGILDGFDENSCGRV